MNYVELDVNREMSYNNDGRGIYMVSLCMHTLTTFTTYGMCVKG